jgi:predicted secreted protein
MFYSTLKVGGMNESNDTTEKRNEIFVLEFPEIPSSGYIWQTLSIPKGVTLISDEFIPDSEHAVGGGGVHRFRFQVTLSQKPVILALGRPWDDHEVLKLLNYNLLTNHKID